MIDCLALLMTVRFLVRSLYCSCDDDCDAGALELRIGLEKLLFDNGVDFFLNGKASTTARLRVFQLPKVYH